MKKIHEKNFQYHNKKKIWAAYYYDFWRSCDTEDCSNDAENTAWLVEYMIMLNALKFIFSV